MAEFLKDSQLASAIEELIDGANENIFLISPYIKLHERVKDRLKLKKDNPKVNLVVVFGKNEEDITKSLSKEDFEFLKDFPSVTIGYEKRLHAKFYASDYYSIITSMNLHEFSQNNNIEVGVKLESKFFSGNTADADAYEYFQGVVDNSTIIYHKEAQFKSGLMGIGSSYTHSEVLEDKSDDFFKKKEVTGTKYIQRKRKENTPEPATSQGYCIRTGKPIPFDLKRPMCYEAFQSWNQYKNIDFKEKFCHKTGKPSNGKTSMRIPVM